MLDRYNSLLSSVQSLCPTAHIGGGAVRDTLLGQPVRDIDLFLDDAHTDAAAALLRSKYSFVKTGEWECYEMFSDPAVARLAKFEKADETIPVCLIGLREARDMRHNLARFDFGVCMAAWDGDTVYTAPEYRADIEAKTFTLCRADDQPQFNYSMVRFQKLTAERYAGWRLVVPPRFEKFAREFAFHKFWYPSDDGLGFRLPWDLYGKQQLRPKAR
jgi:hypothetical protein